VNLTRFHGVFAPNSRHRANIVNRKSSKKLVERDEQTAHEKRRARLKAARLKRAFNIEIKICERCGGRGKVIACIEDPVVINKILQHLALKPSNQIMLERSRAPPVGKIA
jgi:hypothetical protein